MDNGSSLDDLWWFSVTKRVFFSSSTVKNYQFGYRESHRLLHTAFLKGWLVDDQLYPSGAEIYMGPDGPGRQFTAMKISPEI